MIRDRRTSDLFEDDEGPVHEPIGAPGVEDAADLARISGQRDRVRALMRDGRWRTLNEVATAARCSEASASARLRDLRKDAFGGHRVTRRLRFEEVRGLFEYRVEADRGEGRGDDDRGDDEEEGGGTHRHQPPGTGAGKGTHLGGSPSLPGTLSDPMTRMTPKRVFSPRPMTRVTRRFPEHRNLREPLGTCQNPL